MSNPFRYIAFVKVLPLSVFRTKITRFFRASLWWLAPKSSPPLRAGACGGGFCFGFRLATSWVGVGKFTLYREFPLSALRFPCSARKALAFLRRACGVLPLKVPLPCGLSVGESKAPSLCESGELFKPPPLRRGFGGGYSNRQP